MPRRTRPRQQPLKKLTTLVQGLQADYPHDVVELWTMDQHRLRPKPILRGSWGHRGQRPAAGVQHRYQWCYLYAFVHPPSGRT
jgi:hypothetical protein